LGGGNKFFMENPFKNIKPENIRFAETVEVTALKANMDKLLSILAKFHGCKDELEIRDWLKYCFVSDLSSLSDFLDVNQVLDMSQKLGFEVGHRDYLKDIAARMGPPN